MKQTENVKGRGFKRKTSLGLVCGIALTGAFFLGANGVSADEAKAQTPTATPTATATDSKTVTVDEGLTETANKAKEAGLKVNAEPTKNLGVANTEEEAKKIEAQAKKDVADQKAEIEKTVAEYKASSQEGNKKRQETVDKLNQEGKIYNTTADGLREMGDDAYNKGQTSYGGFTSSKGTVRYLDAPSEFNADKIDPTVAVLDSAIGTAPKEITMKYAGGNVFGATHNSLKERSTLKVVPILVNDGETITYKVNVAGDSELGKLGIKTVERSLTLKGSPVGTKGKVALLADRTGSVTSNYIFGGLGSANEVMNNGKEFDVVSTWNYLDASGKAIDSKELASKFVNTKWYPTLNLKASEIKTAPTTDNKTASLNFGTDDTKTLSDKFVNGGSKFTEATRKYKLGEGYTAKHKDPVENLMSYHSNLPAPVNENFSSPKEAPTVNYHLVSYTVNKPKATNNPDTVKKGSIVQVFIEEGGKEIAPKTNTGAKPVDEAVKLTHPNEITFEGKTYTFTKQDKADLTKIPNGTETITYIYKLKEAPKPVEKPTPKPTPTPQPVPTPTPTPKPVPTPTPVENPTTIHIDTEGKTVAPKEDGTKPFKAIDGYEPAPKDSKNVVNPKGETVRVYSQIKKGNVEVRYIKDDKERTVLKEPVADTVGGKVGSDYDTTDHKPNTITKDGVTYELVRTEGVEKGKVVEGKTVVTYVYRQTVEPTTIHIDEEGNRVAPPEKGTKPFKNIEGFEPSPKNPKNVENPKGETVRVYKVVKGDVEVRYVKDDKERTPLKEPVADTTQAKVGTKYDTTDHKPVTITKDGVTYELVRTEGTEKGDVVKGKTVVTYVYREVQKPITIHVDTEGNPVAPQEDGTKPFKEIEGYKPAPKDSKNVENPKGVTVRVYDKVKPEAPQEAPKTPEKPEAPKPTAQAYVTNTLPNTGSEASTALAIAGMGIFGLSVLSYKKKED